MNNYPVYVMQCGTCGKVFEHEDVESGPPDYAGYPYGWQIVTCECGGYAGVIEAAKATDER